MMQTDSTEATFRTKSVPNMATTNMEHTDQECTQQIWEPRQCAERSAARGKCDRRSHAHDTDVEHLEQIGEHRRKLPVKCIVVRPVIVYLMFPRKSAGCMQKTQCYRASQAPA